MAAHGKIIDSINTAVADGQTPLFSFEFFPPKTDEGRENLYMRMDRMCALEPLFVDITWGAGGSTAESTMEICKYAQTYFGTNVLMHLTCTGMTETQLLDVLHKAKGVGIRNILALQGDAPKGKLDWLPTPGGCPHAVDLVRLIRKHFGAHFCIAVGGFPEGHPRSGGNLAHDVSFLKEKVAAGADFVLTQFFYDVSVFTSFVARCREAGITVPILPGMMPIQSFSSFQRMTTLCGTKVPANVASQVNELRHDEQKLKEYGIKQCRGMCEELLASNTCPGFHFYTLNLERSVTGVVKSLSLGDSLSLCARRALPWRSSRSTLNGKEEEVRPINWANRPKSYISRTLTWDDFPNGRWGDAASPAFGELDDSHFVVPAIGSKQARLAMWGEAPVTHSDVHNVFALYVGGKIPILPWCETPLQEETSTIQDTLCSLNRSGLLTINSQPAVNGAPSSHPVFGWGGSRGYVYQRAYLEFFCSAETLELITAAMQEDFPGKEGTGECVGQDFLLAAINADGHTVTIQDLSNGRNRSISESDRDRIPLGSGCSNSSSSSTGRTNITTALTWGVFPNKEIKQPTVFDLDAFEVWSKEAFKLWVDSWAGLYDDESESSGLLYDIHDTYYLVAMIDNDYVGGSADRGATAVEGSSTLLDFLRQMLPRLADTSANSIDDGGLEF